MNGSNVIRIVIDTNVLFMALYNPFGKAGKIIELANKEKIKLFSTDTVKQELSNVLRRELDFSEEQIILNILKLPITWVEKEVYSEFLDKTKVKHKADKPVEALSLVLNCGILSADYHFKNRIDINRLLDDLED